MDERLASAAQAARNCLDRLVRNTKAPGIQYAVVAPDQLVFEYTAGWADVAGGRRVGPTTTMMAYSMSKTVTAAAALQLLDARKVKLDDSIAIHLESEPYGPEVTVGQLLSHTSGIPNPIPLRWVHRAVDHSHHDERGALAKVLLEHPRLSFPPGTRYRYSNIGYWLLGSIVERTSGESFPDYVREHVLLPLGIEPEELGYEIANLDNHAKGYLEKYSLMNLVKRVVIAGELIGGYEGRWLRLEDHYVNGAAFGGLVGNARGFARFLQDQLRPHSVLFGDATRQLFYAPQHTKSGTPIPITLGWHVGALDGAGYFYKEGAGGGFHSMMRLYRSCGVATVVMANATGLDVSALLDATDRPFLLASDHP